MHRVQLRLRQCCFAQNEHDAALRADVTVGIRRKGAGEPCRREHCGLRKRYERHRTGDDVDAGDDCGVDLPAAQGLGRLMQRDQRGGAGGIQCDARAAQIEYVGNAVAEDRRASYRSQNANPRPLDHRSPNGRSRSARRRQRPRSRSRRSNSAGCLHLPALPRSVAAESAAADPSAPPREERCRTRSGRSPKCLPESPLPRCSSCRAPGDAGAQIFAAKTGRPEPG